MMPISDGKSDGEMIRRRKSDIPTEKPTENDRILKFRRRIFPSEFPLEFLSARFKKFSDRILRVLEEFCINLHREERERVSKEGREREQGRERRMRCLWFPVAGDRKDLVSSPVI